MHPALLRYLKCHIILITRETLNTFYFFFLFFSFLKAKKSDNRTTFLKDSFIVTQNNCCDLVSHCQ